MSNFFNFGSAEQRKKMTFIAIYATIAVIVCLLSALLITQIVANTKKDEPEDLGDETSDPAVNFSEETVTSAQLHTGSLILVNTENEYIFDDNPAVVNIKSVDQHSRTLSCRRGCRLCRRYSFLRDGRCSSGRGDTQI